MTKAEWNDPVSVYCMVGHIDEREPPQLLVDRLLPPSINPSGRSVHAFAWLAVGLAIARGENVAPVTVRSKPLTLINGRPKKSAK